MSEINFNFVIEVREYAITMQCARFLYCSVFELYY